MKKILVINPGSTSTKVAYYVGNEEIFKEDVFLDLSKQETYKKVFDEYEDRLNSILEFLVEKNVNIDELDCVVSRGGLLPSVDAGAYKITEAMITYLENSVVEHASNLGAKIALGIREKTKDKNCECMIYDPVTVNQFTDLAKVSGLPGVDRKCTSHALNMRSVAIKVANDKQIDYKDLNIIVAHLGSGISVSLHSHGRMIDTVLDDEGSFSVERCGGLPLKQYTSYSEGKSVKEILDATRKKSGLIGYLGTNNGKEIEERINNGDEYAKFIMQALAYQISKSIGTLAPVVNGDIDYIVLTGGLAYSQLVTSEITQRVSYLGEVIRIPGEFEMLALSAGANRVLNNEEELKEIEF